MIIIHHVQIFAILVTFDFSIIWNKFILNLWKIRRCHNTIIAMILDCLQVIIYQSDKCIVCPIMITFYI